MSTTAFVAGATGYVGSNVVELLCERDDVGVVAHVRPDSSRLDHHRESFETLGARVDTTPWEDDAMTDRFAQLRPDVVFCCIGTTRARKKASDEPEKETYEAVDFGLTALLVRACVEAEISPRFVYISAAGASPKSRSSYMKARWDAETYIHHSELPYVIARPSFITGPGREESRPGERVGATLADAGLTLAGLIGFVGFRDRYKSISGPEFASALVDLAFDPAAEGTVAEGRELHRRAE